jgi:hypothetical protein
LRKGRVAEYQDPHLLFLPSKPSQGYNFCDIAQRIHDVILLWFGRAEQAATGAFQGSGVESFVLFLLHRYPRCLQPSTGSRDDFQS